MTDRRMVVRGLVDPEELVVLGAECFTVAVCTAWVQAYMVWVVACTEWVQGCMGWVVVCMVLVMVG